MTESTNTDSRTISGRALVTGMFSLGILATAFLWIHWTLRMTPFLPLQQALEQEFPNSSPRAEGGTLKKTGDSVLKVVLRTDFDPQTNSPASHAKILERLDRIRFLATNLADLSKYEVLALTLYFPQKEKRISQKTFFRRVSTWTELQAAELIGRRYDP